VGPGVLQAGDEGGGVLERVSHDIAVSHANRTEDTPVDQSDKCVAGGGGAALKIGEAPESRRVGGSGKADADVRLRPGGGGERRQAAAAGLAQPVVRLRSDDLEMHVAVHVRLLGW
jgi:hypothetical protein